MKINEIIKEKRLALGYTQEQLAKFLNLTTPAVNKWERGISYPHYYFTSSSKNPKNRLKYSIVI